MARYDSREVVKNLMDEAPEYGNNNTTKLSAGGRFTHPTPSHLTFGADEWKKGHQGLASESMNSRVSLIAAGR
jgi:hypothetical protein